MDFHIAVQNACSPTRKGKPYDTELLCSMLMTWFFFLNLDYATEIFHDALIKGYHICSLKPDTCLPMMYIDDCLRAVIEMLNAPHDQLRLRTYNVNAMNFTPAQLTEEVRKYFPKFEIRYKPDGRQAIGEDKRCICILSWKLMSLYVVNITVYFTNCK